MVLHSNIPEQDSDWPTSSLDTLQSSSQVCHEEMAQITKDVTAKAIRAVSGQIRGEHE